MSKPKKQNQLLTIPLGSSLDSVEIIIGQDSDCCSKHDIGNNLTISTPDGGGGKYIVIDGRWAMGNDADIDALANMLKELLEKVESE